MNLSIGFCNFEYMKSKNYNVIGVMSGTSLDGVDLAHITFTYTNKWEFVFNATETVPYSSKWEEILKKAVFYSNEQLQTLNIEYTQYLSQIILDFIQQQGIQHLDFVSSHGHTVQHDPKNKHTLQIGNLPQLATLIKKDVVCNFRVSDVQLGGHGAPLVPIGDAMLFYEYDYCINLGGFSNISFSENNKRIAFDISPVNTVLNWYSSKMGFPYDEGGKIAATGELNLKLYEALNSIPFFNLKAPKSLGIEFVHQTILPLIDSFQLDIPTILHTFCKHVAHQIGKVILTDSSKKMLITGGGVYNHFLISEIKKTVKAEVVLPSDDLISFKEALIFAFLGVLRLENKVNILASVTGAKMDHCSGEYFKP